LVTGHFGCTDPSLLDHPRCYNTFLTDILIFCNCFKWLKGLYSSSWKVGNTSQRYGASPAIWDHTVLQHCHPTQLNTSPHLNPSQASRYSIYLPQSCPWWMVIHRDGLPVRRQSPILVATSKHLTVTRPGVEPTTL